MSTLLKGKCPAFMTFELSIILKSDSSGILKKAGRQKWNFYEEYEGPGSPTKYYPLETLPDDIQIAWAEWDKEKANAARIAEELKGDNGRLNRIPEPVTRELAEQALSMPIRQSWFKQFPPGQRPRKGGKVYDGHSRGLCNDARRILLQCFPDLANIKPGDPVEVDPAQATSVNETATPTAYKPTQPKPRPPKPGAMSAASDQAVDLLKTENARLDEIRKECGEEKKQILEMYREEKEIWLKKEEAWQQERNELKDAIRNMLGKNEQLSHQVELFRDKADELRDKTDRFRDKYEDLLTAELGKKRDSGLPATDNTTPSTGKHASTQD